MVIGQVYERHKVFTNQDGGFEEGLSSLACGRGSKAAFKDCCCLKPEEKRISGIWC
jgi:hypothetical protein